MSIPTPLRRSSAVLVPALLALAAFFVAGPVLAKEAQHVARYRMIAMTSTGPGVQGAAELDVTINRWSTEAERAALLAAYQKGGNVGLYQELQKQPSHGYFSQPGSLGYQIRYAHLVRTDSGSRVIIVNDTFVSDANFDSNSEFLKYPITLAEMKLGADGKGTGTMVVGARIAIEKDGVMRIETSGQAPIPLTKIWETK